MKFNIFSLLLIGIMSFIPISLAKANNISQIDRSFIMRNEGIILFPYRDSAGYSTICVGHLVTKFDNIKQSYTMEECLDIFERDLSLLVIENNNCFSTSQNDDQYTAIIDFTFNIGTKASCSSSLLRDISNNKDQSIIDNDFMKWRYVTINGKLVPVQGIINRREREVERYNGLK